MDPKSVILGGSLGLAVAGRDFFFIALARVKLRSAVRERTRPPNWRTTSANLWFPCPIFRYMHYFSGFSKKTWSPPRHETYFWRSTHTILHPKVPLFGPLGGREIGHLPHFVRSYRSFFHSVSFCCRSMGLLKNLLSPECRAFFASKPPTGKTTTARQPSNCELLLPFILFYLPRML